MSFEMKGKIKAIMDEQRFDSGFYKREFVVTTNEQYPQDIKFELMKEKVEMLGGMSVGDAVNVKFDIRGREWNGNYYVNLNAWKLEAEGAATPAPAGGAPGAPSAPLPSAEPIDLSSEEDDDLPF
ncbi:MAG: DUF3127 domain-containing protein [Bacteroidota bacterium]